MAQAVCASMDAMYWQGFVGTPWRERILFLSFAANDAAALETQEEFEKLISR